MNNFTNWALLVFWATQVVDGILAACNVIAPVNPISYIGAAMTCCVFFTFEIIKDKIKEKN